MAQVTTILTRAVSTSKRLFGYPYNDRSRLEDHMAKRFFIVKIYPKRPIS